MMTYKLEKYDELSNQMSCLFLVRNSARCVETIWVHSNCIYLFVLDRGGEPIGLQRKSHHVGLKSFAYMRRGDYLKLVLS